MKKLATKLLVALGLLTSGGVMAQTSGTIGITQALNETAKTVGARELHRLDHLEVVLVKGEKVDVFTNQTNRKPQLDGVEYTTTGDCYRKNLNDSDPATPGYQDNQYVGFQIKIESGYCLNISSLYARLMVADDTYTWKVKITDVAKGTTLFESEDKTTKKASSAVLNQTMKFSGLTGEIQVLLYMHQNGGTKYFVADNFTVQGTVQKDARPTKTITTSVDANGGGTVSPSGEFSCVEGESTQIEAVANPGYTFVSWLIDGTETVTTNPYKFENVTAAHTAVATFAKNPVLSFAKPEGVYCVKSMFPKGVNTVAKGGKATLPAANYMYYKEGYTMTGWSIGGTDYAFGAEVTLNEDVTAEPVFAENTVSLAARNAEVTVTYNFNTSENGGRLVKIEGNADKVITEATVDGNKIDVMMDVDCQTGAGIADKRGKLNNVSTDGTTAQCNVGTVLTIHDVVKGSVITLTCSSENVFSTATTFNGAAGKLSGKKAITYTATEDGDVKVIVADKNIYLTTITVTYPYVAPKEYKFVAEDDDFYTLYLDYAVTVPANVKAYTGALNGNNMVLAEITDGYIKAGNAVLIQAKAADAYTFVENTTAEAGTYNGNALKGVLVDTPLSDIEKQGTVLTLGKNSEDQVGFRQPKNTYVSANKAYIDYVNNAPGAPAFVRILLPGEVTGIEGVQSVQQKATTNAIYNMMGQRVDANAKGLILMNGKKVIRK